MTGKLTPPQSTWVPCGIMRPRRASMTKCWAPAKQLRPHWGALSESLTAMGNKGLTRRWREGQRLIHDNGITYNVYSDPESTSRPWPLDPVPLMMDPAEWKTIEAAVIQRATLFNSILADLYGPQRLLREKMIPAELVFPNPAFLRPCWGIEPPGGVFLHMYAADLARSPDGQWWVLADRTQAPSGAGYALENRLVTTRVLPDVFRASHIRRLANFFQTYREALQRLVPANRENPRIVLLTPGPYNETYFEHAFLARYLGFTLVEGGDLTVRDNRVYLKTLGGLLPVDVIVRRQDDQFCDPLELRGDSMLGVPALVQAVRSGNVAIANCAWIGPGGVSRLRCLPSRTEPSPIKRGLEDSHRRHLVVRPERAARIRAGSLRQAGPQAHLPRHAWRPHLRRGSEQPRNAKPCSIACALNRTATWPRSASRFPRFRYGRMARSSRATWWFAFMRCRPAAAMPSCPAA